MKYIRKLLIVFIILIISNVAIANAAETGIVTYLSWYHYELTNYSIVGYRAKITGLSFAYNDEIDLGMRHRFRGRWKQGETYHVKITAIDALGIDVLDVFELEINIINSPGPKADIVY